MARSSIILIGFVPVVAILSVVVSGRTSAEEKKETPVVLKLRAAHSDFRVVVEAGGGTQSIIESLIARAGVKGVPAEAAAKVLAKVTDKFLGTDFADCAVAVVYSKDLENEHNNPGFALLVSEISPVGKATKFVKTGAVAISKNGGVVTTGSLGGFSIGDTKGEPAFGFGVIVVR